LLYSTYLSEKRCPKEPIKRIRKLSIIERFQRQKEGFFFGSSWADSF
jgi:hypothetical protein